MFFVLICGSLILLSFACVVFVLLPEFGVVCLSVCICCLRGCVSVWLGFYVCFNVCCVFAVLLFTCASCCLMACVFA